MAMASLTIASSLSSSFHGNKLSQTEFFPLGKCSVLSRSSLGFSSRGVLSSSSIVCLITRSKEGEAPANLEKEPHKYFDQVTIVVRSGDGGDGAILSMPKPPATKEDAKKQKKLNWGPLRKAPDGTVMLPMGGQGGDVVIAADEAADSLIPFHHKKRYKARRGSNVDALKLLTPKLRDAGPAPTLKISVPVGTVVKQKKGSKLLADLARPGDQVVVANGGRGGISILETPVGRKLPNRVNAPILDDPRDKSLIKGVQGQEFVLELTLRVVADIGLVGLPNAGKSSLLAAVSQARPDIAPYPFTTLMPNLGRIEGDPDGEGGGFGKGATLADLPGLIKDAHLGKGLGRMFLRHLRRTRLILHVVDVSAESPVEDYKVLCEELRMYNPEYLDRPHIVVLNKLDLLVGRERFEMIRKQFYEAAAQPSTSSSSSSEPVKSFPAAVAVVGISALKREGITILLKQVRSTLRKLEQEAEETTTNYVDEEISILN